MGTMLIFVSVVTTETRIIFILLGSLLLWIHLLLIVALIIFVRTNSRSIQRENLIWQHNDDGDGAFQVAVQVLNNQTNETANETVNETVNETANETANETVNETANETFNPTTLQWVNCII